MSGHQQGKPEKFHTITPAIIVRDGAKAIDFYKKAFGAKELERMDGPGGKVMHAEIQIGDSIFFLGEEMPEMGAFSPDSTGGKTTGSLHLYVQNVDEAFNQAVNAGAKAAMPVADMFWGDRYGKVVDPFGHTWGLATHVKDLTPEEMKKAADAFFAQTSRK